MDEGHSGLLVEGRPGRHRTPAAGSAVQMSLLVLFPPLIRPIVQRGFPGGTDGKESACNAGDPGAIPWSGRSPGGGLGNPLQHFCLENPHGWRTLAGYSPWGRKELDATERLTLWCGPRIGRTPWRGVCPARDLRNWRS